MSWWSWFWTGWVCFVCLVWIATGWRILLTIRGLPVIAKIPLVPPTQWPKLSVIIPACNEESTLEAALQTLLHQDYPNLELILINDRSTDQTGHIMERMAGQDPRIRVLHIDILPEGWLGKVHALHVGTQHASGEWMLFTDADVHFRSDALRYSVAYAVNHDLDMLSMLPEFVNHSFWLDVVVGAFGQAYCTFLEVWKVNHRPSTAFAGVGAFNLVRREAFLRTEGMSWLRMEVGDDVGLGYMLFRSGAQLSIAYGRHLIRVTWYPSLKAMLHGVEKNFFGILTQYSYGLAVFFSVVIPAIFLTPIVVLWYSPVPYLWMAGAVPLLLHVGISWPFGRWLNMSYLSVLLAHLGHIMVLGFLWNAAFYCWHNNGVKWRGTYYPLDALRQGQRLTLRAVLKKPRHS